MKRLNILRCHYAPNAVSLSLGALRSHYLNEAHWCRLSYDLSLLATEEIFILKAAVVRLA